MSLEVTVAGKDKQYSAQVMDLSAAGVLIKITDRSFAAAALFGDYLGYMKRVSAVFGKGMEIVFDAHRIRKTATIVHVRGSFNRPGEPPLVACRFEKTLTAKECAPFGLDPGSPRDILEALPEANLIEKELPEIGKPGMKAEKSAAPAAEPAEAPSASGFNPLRSSERSKCCHRVELFGDHGSYFAFTLDISDQGALINLSDSGFFRFLEEKDLFSVNKLIHEHFGRGFAIRFVENDLVIQADPVRVKENADCQKRMISMGCRFRRRLTEMECEAMQIESPTASSPAAEPAPLEEAKVEQEIVDKAGAHPALDKPAAKPSKHGSILELMRRTHHAGASDLHIKVGCPPRMRVNGSLFAISEEPVLREEADAMASELLSPAQMAAFELEGDQELAVTIEGAARFRVNLLRQRDCTGLAVRCIPNRIPTLEELKISPVARVLAEKPRGLVLVTGPTGSGKSTTLAAMIRHINHTKSCHILTMEDPIEYVHEDVLSYITQRQVGKDVTDFKAALRRALRQDPDVILVGEMRDLDTIALALTAAETGHLVLAILHTTSAAMITSRVVDVFPPGQQQQIRLQFADTFQGSITQLLLPREDGERGVVVAQEILVATDGVRALIRESKGPQIHNLIQTGAEVGMQTLETSLNHLVEKRTITYETAVSKANFPKQINRCAR